jgi:type IV secretory pathway TraG/TraD family ATPase VirD4
LAWLTDATAAACADGTDEAMLNIEQFLTDAGTLYLLGAEDAIVAPLVTALTAEIARTARRIAADQGGRLDPPLTLALDEAALICPVPLDRWTADMGGRNVTIHIGAQSRARLRQRWGEVGAAAIVNNASTILVFGGMRDPDDLRAFEALSGEREDITYTRNPAGQITGSSNKRVPVLTAAQLANLPARRVMVVRRGLPANIGRVQMAWQRRTVRRAMRNTDRQPAGGIPTNAHHRGDQLVTEDQQQPTPTRNPAATPPVLPDFDGPFATARKE